MLTSPDDPDKLTSLDDPDKSTSPDDPDKSTRPDGPDKPRDAKKRRMIGRSMSIDLMQRFSTKRDSAFKQMVLAPRLSWSGGQHLPAEATPSNTSLGDKRLVGPRVPESINLHYDSFRERFTFLVPLRFKQFVASIPAPLPGGRWKYSVNHEEMNVVGASNSPDPNDLYRFGRRDEIKDLDMEDGFSGGAYPPLIGGVDQTVSLSFCVSILNDPSLTANIS